MAHIKIESKDIEIEVNDDEIILFALMDRGIKYPHGCMSGSCGSCRTEILEGSENISPMSALEKNTIDSILEYLVKTKGEDFLKGRKIRLACRTRVKGDITIKPFK